jgi:ribosome-associated protein
MQEVTKSKSLEREPATDTLEVIIGTTPFEEIDDEVKLAVHSASEKKAVNIKVLDLRAITSFTEFFVITNGTNQRQVQAIADEITEKLKKKMKYKANRIEGYDAAEWVLLDYGDFVVHIFNQKSREFYDLERLWRDARRVELPEDL